MKKVPLRKCLGCRESKPKKDLLRIVKNKENQIFVDKTGKLNGRGTYICYNMDCLNLAIKQKSFERELEISKLDNEIIESIKREIEE